MTRTSCADVSILLGLFALAFVVAGGADGARLGPALTVVVGAVCGAGVYFAGPYPWLLRVLSWMAAVLTVGGLIALGLVVS